MFWQGHYLKEKGVVESESAAVMAVLYYVFLLFNLQKYHFHTVEATKLWRSGCRFVEHVQHDLEEYFEAHKEAEKPEAFQHDALETKDTSASIRLISILAALFLALGATVIVPIINRDGSPFVCTAAPYSCRVGEMKTLCGEIVVEHTWNLQYGCTQAPTQEGLVHECMMLCRAEDSDVGQQRRLTTTTTNANGALPGAVITRVVDPSVHTHTENAVAGEYTCSDAHCQQFTEMVTSVSDPTYMTSGGRRLAGGENYGLGALLDMARLRVLGVGAINIRGRRGVGSFDGRRLQSYAVALIDRRGCWESGVSGVPEKRFSFSATSRDFQEDGHVDCSMHNGFCDYPNHCEDGVGGNGVRKCFVYDETTDSITETLLSAPNYVATWSRVGCTADPFFFLQEVDLSCPGQNQTMVGAFCVCDKGYRWENSGTGTGTGGRRLHTVDECVACTEGRFKSTVSTTNNICQVCSAGSYTASAPPSSNPDFVSVGAKYCNLCPAGKFSTNSSACFDCAAGHYLDPSGSCTACPAGQYDDDGNFSTVCVECTAGSITNGTGNPLTGATACTACDAGKYSTTNIVETATTCTDCTAGNITNMGAGTGAQTCTACAAGKFSTSSNVATCTDCTAGNITNMGAGTGAQTCTACAAGRFSTSSNVATCQACPQDTYQVLPGQSACIQKTFVACESSHQDSNTHCLPTDPPQGGASEFCHPTRIQNDASTQTDSTCDGCTADYLTPLVCGGR
jgi:hypothetical protein